MGKINVLDKHVAELIAAGEVVDRPSSVIKELCENSIDAGASKITVEIQNGGKTLMRVSDNGSGIDEDDIKKAFIRNATSKIKQKSDLDKISTLGFRGEALASISSVAKVELITKTASAAAGISYKIYGGEEKEKKFIGCPLGTTFIVRDLFYNVPARLKFLKKDVSEGNSVSGVIDRIALSHPDISFVFIRDGKKVLSTTGDGKLYNAIYSIFGSEFAKSLTEINYTLGDVSVEGFISKVDCPKATRGMQHFFINGRYVKTKTAMAALEEAYKGNIMVGKFPACVLNIIVPFDTVDVNVHPAKIEVRFENEKPIFDCVYHGVKSTLLKTYEHKEMLFKLPTQEKIFPIKNESLDEKAKIPEISKNSDDDEPEIFMPKPLNIDNAPIDSFKDKIFTNVLSVDNQAPEKEKQEDININEYKSEILSVSDVLAENKEFSDDGIITPEGFDNQSPKIIDIPLIEKETPSDSDKNGKISENDAEIITPFIKNEDKLTVIGEAFDTYIILQKNNDELLFVDKHAAHERILYEKFKNERGTSYKQYLLSPVCINMPVDLYNAVLENKALLDENGYEVDDFGKGIIIVYAVPQYINLHEVEDAVCEIAEHLSKSSSSLDTEKSDWIFHNTACRAAVKAGKESHYSEIIALVNELAANPNITHCPHGRPITVSMKKKEFDKQFGRIL